MSLNPRRRGFQIALGTTVIFSIPLLIHVIQVQLGLLSLQQTFEFLLMIQWPLTIILTFFGGTVIYYFNSKRKDFTRPFWDAFSFPFLYYLLLYALSSSVVLDIFAFGFNILMGCLLVIVSVIPGSLLAEFVGNRFISATIKADAWEAGVDTQVTVTTELNCPQCNTSLRNAKFIQATKQVGDGLVTSAEISWTICPKCGFTVSIDAEHSVHKNWAQLVQRDFYLPLYCQRCQYAYFDENRQCPKCGGAN